MNKNIYLMLMLIVLSPMLVSAFEFDNVKDNYNEAERSIDIVNSYGAGSTIAHIKLIKNTDQALINGEAIFEVELLEDYTEGVVDGTDFINENNEAKNFNGEWSYQLEEIYTVDIPTHSEICEDVFQNTTLICSNEQTGYTSENRSRLIWKQYNGEDMDKGIYLFRLTAKKQAHEAVDFIPFLFGVEIEEFAWWNVAWQLKRQINITDTYVDSNLINFTHLIKLNTSNFDFGSAQANGEDIRFLNSTETGELSYEIEFWNSTNAIIWVRIPELESAEDTVIFMYYDNSLASDGQDVVDAWGTNYLAVYHMAEDSTGTPPPILASATASSAANLNTYSDTNSSDIRTYGMLGYSADFDGNTGNRYMRESYFVDPDSYNAGLSLSIWFNKNESNSDESIMAFRDAGIWGKIRINLRSSNGMGYTFGCGDSACAYEPIAGLTYNLNTWNHVAISHSAANNTMYVNGTLVHNIAPFAGLTNNANVLGIAGYGATDANAVSEGMLDEARIMTIEMTPAWAKADYYSMADEMNIIGIADGGQQGGAAIQSVPTNGSVNNYLNLNFTAYIQSTNPSNITNGTIRIWKQDGTIENETFFDFPSEDSSSETLTNIYNFSGDYFGNETLKWDVNFCITIGLCSNGGNINFTGTDTNISFFIDTVNPVLNLSRPVVYNHLSGIPLTYTYIENHPSICKYNIDGGSNTTNTCTSNDTTFTTTGFGSHTLNLFMNDTVGNDGDDSIGFILLENISQTYESSTIELNEETYSIVLNDTTSSITSVEFIYENVNYVATLSDETGTEKTYTSTLNVPEVTVGDADTYNFGWNVTVNYLSNVGSVYYGNFTQTVNNIIIVPTTDGSTCDSVTATEYALNFTFINESSGAVVTGVESTTYLEVWTQEESDSIQFSWIEDHVGVSKYPVCLFPNDVDILSNFKMSYGGEDTDFGYREFNVQTFLFNDTVTQLFDLYIVESTETTTITTTVIDSTGLALQDYLIKAIKLNYGNVSNLEILIDSQVTDNDGIVLFELDPDNYYKFEVWKDGVLIQSEEPAFILKDTTLTIIVDLENILNPGLQTSIVEGITFTDIVYTESTGLLTTTYIDSDDLSDEVCFRTINLTAKTGATSSVCSTNTTGSFSVSVGNYTGLRYAAHLIAEVDGYFYTLDSFDVDLRDGGNSTFGSEGLLWGGVIAVSTIALLAVPSNAGVIILGILTLGVMTVMLNIVSLGVGSIAFLLLIAGAFIFYMRT
jgi:hypothetical protein